MTGPPIAFPDSVSVARAYLQQALDARGLEVPVRTRVPSLRPPRFVRLERIGGARLDLITDRPRIDVHVWGEDDDDVADLVGVVRPLMLAMPGLRGGVRVYDVAEVGGPNTLPDPVSDQPRVAFAVEVSMRGTTLAP
ncbi:hypothetical protein ACFWIK_00890 [Streptomyces anthocyanicus]|uniref:hypothetical protein n=1 Tax=Streptomyces anthocyanicus TaxID=68174 RepID=UPI00364F76B8